MVSATIESGMNTMVQQKRIAMLEAENDQLRERLHDNKIRRGARPAAGRADGRRAARPGAAKLDRRHAMRHASSARSTSCAPNGATRFDVDGRPVAVVRIGDDVYAIGDTCSHADVSLQRGRGARATSSEIECWKHGSTFSLVDRRAADAAGDPAGAGVRRPGRRRRRGRDDRATEERASEHARDRGPAAPRSPARQILNGIDLDGVAPARCTR